MAKLYKTSMFLFGILIFAFSAKSQQIEQCGFNYVKEYYENIYPGYKQAEEQAYRERIAKVQYSKAPFSEDSTYTIPVVFHIVWNTNSPEQNLHDSVIYDQLRVLNEDFKRLNPDTINMRSEFMQVAGNPNVRFVLANINPNGEPQLGIVRKETTATFGGGFFPDMASISKIQHDADGGSDAWDPTHYLNIWVGDINGGSASPSLLGIATPPPNLPNWPANSTPAELTDGVCIQFQAFGSNNPNTLDLGQGPITVNGRTVTHEVGHYTGLRHTGENTFGGFGGDVCVSQNNDPTADDGLLDTPDCDQSAQDCDTQRNSCVDDINGVDLPDMIENYMDYSDAACQNSFTNGQAHITRSVLSNERDTLSWLEGYELTGDVDTSYTIDAGEFLGDINGNGLLDNNEVVGDWSGDGIISGDEIAGDANGDGVVNSLDNVSSNTLVSDAAFDNSVLVFPNPNSGNFIVQFGLETHRIEIKNALGQTIESRNVQNKSSEQISISTSGVYFLNIYSNSNKATKRIVVK